MKDEETKRPGSYNGYEYREISVPEWLSSLCMDSYPCFGWEPDPNRNESKEKKRFDRPAKRPWQDEYDPAVFSPQPESLQQG